MLGTNHGSPTVTPRMHELINSTNEHGVLPSSKGGQELRDLYRLRTYNAAELCRFSSRVWERRVSLESLGFHPSSLDCFAQACYIGRVDFVRKVYILSSPL